MSSGIYAQYNPQLRVKTQKSNTIIPPVLGVNPVDTTAVPLHNIRGEVTITISTTDDPVGTEASFLIRGGYGQYPDDPTWNWYIDSFSLEYCTAVQIVQNTFEITTLAPLVIRTYTFIFNPRIMYGPTIQRTGGVLLGTETLTVTQSKQVSAVSQQNFW